MAVEISLHRERDALEVCLRGEGDPDLLARLGAVLAQLAAAEEPRVAVNCDELSLFDPGQVRSLVRALANCSAGRICLVCARPAGRVLLRRFQLAPAVPVYADLDSALSSARDRSAGEPERQG